MLEEEGKEVGRIRGLFNNLVSKDYQRAKLKITIEVIDPQMVPGILFKTMHNCTPPYRG